MTRELSSSNLPPRELRRLVSSWWDGDISDEEFERLQSALRESRDARAMYFSFATIHAGAKGAASAIGYLDSIQRVTPDGDSIDESDNFNVGPRPMLPLPDGSWGWLAAAAAVLVIGATWSLWPDKTTAVGTRDIIGSVVDQSTDCQWSRDRVEGETAGPAIRAGDVIRVSDGKIKLAYVNGTVLTLHGPAVFEATTGMTGRAILGRLTAEVAEGAEGFSVLTPRATVVDLGTEFGIEVNRLGATDVVVFEGEIDLEYEEDHHGKRSRKRLTTGEAMHFDSRGTRSRIVSVRDEQFSTEMTEPSQGPSRAPLITGVRDNIQREASWNYYQIVPGGLREDARAFVDRAFHEWNGVTQEGMPNYLVGGDYVKTFQNDKFLDDIEIIVELAEPCSLYVLFDDRLTAPVWLRDRFEDTGDKIGVDVGPFDGDRASSREFRTGVGPGASVEDVLTVWKRDIDRPGPVCLGATESPHGDLNMYGIVATPREPSGPGGLESTSVSTSLVR